MQILAANNKINTRVPGIVTTATRDQISADRHLLSGSLLAGAVTLHQLQDAHSLDSPTR